MAHTPGPWAVGEHRGVWVGPVISAAGGKKGIAFVCLSSESDATARLIAAAPELLAALRKAVSLLSYAAQGGGLAGCNADEWFAIESDLNSAINKAEGRGE